MVTAMTQYTTTLSYAAIAEVVNDAVLIMPMIETKEGVENVEYGEPTHPVDDTIQLNLLTTNTIALQGHCRCTRHRCVVHRLRRPEHGVSRVTSDCRYTVPKLTYHLPGWAFLDSMTRNYSSPLSPRSWLRLKKRAQTAVKCLWDWVDWNPGQIS